MSTNDRIELRREDEGLSCDYAAYEEEDAERESRSLERKWDREGILHRPLSLASRESIRGTTEVTTVPSPFAFLFSARSDYVNVRSTTRP